MKPPQDRPDRLPGDRARADPHRMIRVDQAGEYGAVRIYRGQMAVIGPHAPHFATIAHMEAQERPHLDLFNTMMRARGVRPTLLQPLWHVAGFALGAATALAGPRTAMACTAAVEEVIDEHYQTQRAALGDSDPDLSAAIETCRIDEVAHRQTALDQGAEQAPAYPLLARAIRMGCRLAIRLAERI